MTEGAELYDRARAWLHEDPDTETAAALADLISHAQSGDSQAAAELSDAFAGRLEFGTAGLRGQLGPGPNRMNRVVVAQAARGLATYLDGQGLSGGTVIIGYDARHKSARFARDTAEIFAGSGYRALLSTGPVPTPLVPFAIGELGAVAGIVVTASHNPAPDNGYKVYLGDGSQIVPPADAEIAAAIAAVTALPLRDIPRSDRYRSWPDQIQARYVARAAELGDRARGAPLRWLHTALHGVGAPILRQVVEAAGIAPPIEVVQQAEPDPDFSTVTFPNPEEPGAIDLALERAVADDDEAAATGSPRLDLVIANDPDADRCAVAIPGAEPGDPWQMLSGDQLGWLLADDALRREVAGTYACSVVSSVLLGDLAAAHGRSFATTLTGFKWIGRVPELAFGYEEAIGYCCDPQRVPDKDGITAAVTVLALAAQLHAAGSSLRHRLAEISAAHGEHLTDQLSVRVTDLTQISEAMARLRANPPREVNGHPVSVTDLNQGSAELPPTDAVVVTGEGLRAVARPSGTEPKLKVYLEVWAPPTGQVAGPDPRLTARLQQLRDQMQTALAV